MAVVKLLDRPSTRWSLTILGLAIVIAGSVVLRRSLWNDDTLMVSDAAFRYRLARQYAQGTAPPERDRMVIPPEGQSIRNDILLLEDALVGWTYRIFNPSFDERSFNGHLALWVSLVSSLAAASVFLLGYAAWRRRDMALAAALIAAFAVASVDRTLNVYLREHLAVPFILLGWAGMIGVLNRPIEDRPSKRHLPWLIACGLGWGVALTAWHLTGFILTVTVVILVSYLIWKKAWRSVGWVCLVTGGVTLAVGLAVPALRSKGLFLSPAACLLYLTALASLVPRMRSLLTPRRWRIALGIIGGSAILFLVGRALAVGPGGQFGHVYTLFWDKLVHLGQKPADPAELSWISRALWSGPFDGPTLSGFLYSNWLLLPLGIGGAVLLAKRRRGGAPDGSTVILALGAAMLLGFLFFRRLEVLLAPLLALTAAGLLSRIRSWRNLPLAIGLIGLGFFNVYQSLRLTVDNPVRRAFTQLAEHPRAWPHDIGDELRIVIGWIRVNTPPEAVIASRYNIAPMLLAYAARPVALHSIWEAPEVRERARRFTLGQFEGEDDFHDLLSQWGVDYLVVSAADYLDFSGESARYQADALQPAEGRVIEDLCLFPETLTKFRLLFQTTSFRIFGVVETNTGRPFFGDRPAYRLAGSPPDAYPVGEYSPLFDPGSPLVSAAEPGDRSRLIYEALDEYNLGASLFNNGDYTRAAHRFRRVLERVGDLNRARYGLTAALYRSGDYVAAEREIRILFENGFRNLDSLLLYTDILMATGQSQKALTALEDAIGYLPEEARLYEKLAEVYRGLGDHERAEMLRSRAREVSGEN